MSFHMPPISQSQYNFHLIMLPTFQGQHNDVSVRQILVGCFGFNGPLRQYFSLYRAVSQIEGKRGERIDERKNVQTTPNRTYCKRKRPLPYCNPNCRTPRHWKFTQHHRITRPLTCQTEAFPLEVPPPR